MSVLFEDWQPRSTNTTQPKLHSDRASTVHPVVDQAAATVAAAEATTRHPFLTEVLAVAQAEVLAAVQVEAAEVRTEAVPSTKAPLRTTQANP